MSIQSAPRGAFVLSLDLPTAHAATAQVIRQIRTHQVAATWSVPLGSPLAQLADLLGVASGSLGGANELAWRAEPAWADANVGRGKFAVALAERASAALEAGFAMPTLVLDECRAPAHLDVASKYGVRALTGGTGGKQLVGMQPKALRFGVWSVPVSVSISGGGSWWTNQARRAIQEINRAVRTGTVCHVHADLSRGETVAVLDRVLAHVQRCRVEGCLVVETVGQLAARLARPRVATRPARSILRAA